MIQCLTFLLNLAHRDERLSPRKNKQLRRVSAEVRNANFGGGREEGEKRKMGKMGKMGKGKRKKVVESKVVILISVSVCKCNFTT